MPLVAVVYCQSGNTEDRKGISGQASAQVFRELICDHLSAGDGDKSGDMIALDGDIGRSNVVSKLILTGIALKEAIEFDIAASKSRSAQRSAQDNT